MCCPTCDCLGYCSQRDVRTLHQLGFKVLSNRSTQLLRVSAETGCNFCDFAFQACALLEPGGSDRPLEILIYLESPTEIHSLLSNKSYDVVELYTHQTDFPYPHLANSVPNEPYANESLSFIRDCYNTCLRDHANCHQEITPLPKRLVDISSSPYRLVEPEPGASGLYAALSYCWGGLDFRITTSNTLETFKKDISWDLSPAVYKDTANIAQKLKIPYLWIDALCIVQDDTQDWEEQASKMADIFENATITIAASSSSNPGSSIFAERKSPYHEIELVNKYCTKSLGTVFKARRKSTLGIHTRPLRSTEIDPLDLRAWALQEKELSTRFLSFSGAEIQWKCKTWKACECRQIRYPSYPIFHLIGSRSNNDLYVGWQIIVEEYSSRKLTIAHDKLPALSGLATKFYKKTGSKYIAGIWEDNLLFDLAWQRDEESPFITFDQYLAPSFSWASTLGSVNFQLGRHSYDGARLRYLQFLDCRYTTDGSGPYGRAKHGSLTVRGYTISATMKSSISTDAQCYELHIGGIIHTLGTNQRTTCEFALDTPLACSPRSELDEVWLQRSPKDTKEEVSGTVKLLSLFSIFNDDYLYDNFLILGTSTTHTGSYERLGMGTGKMYRSGNDTWIEQQRLGPFYSLVSGPCNGGVDAPMPFTEDIHLV